MKPHSGETMKNSVIYTVLLLLAVLPVGAQQQCIPQAKSTSSTQPCPCNSKQMVTIYNCSDIPPTYGEGNDSGCNIVGTVNCGGSGSGCTYVRTSTVSKCAVNPNIKTSATTSFNLIDPEMDSLKRALEASHQEPKNICTAHIEAFQTWLDNEMKTKQRNVAMALQK